MAQTTFNDLETLVNVRTNVINANANDAETRLSGLEASNLNNLVIDGQFKIWDNGTSFTVDGYSATMWRFSEGGGAATVTRQDFALGQSVVPSNPKHFLRHLQSTNGTNAEMSQRLEDVSLFSGEDLTIEIYADTASGSLSVTPAIRQNFGTGGSPSTEVETIGSAWTILDSGMAKYSVTISVPSVSGKTLGTADDYLELVFKFPDSTTFTFDVANISRATGSSGFIGVWKGNGETRLDVNEYFLRFNGKYDVPMDRDTTANRRGMVLFPMMRAIPDVSFGSEVGWSGSAAASNKEVDQFRISGAATSATTAASVTDITIDARL